MSGARGSSTAGVSTMIYSPHAPARRNGAATLAAKLPLVKRDCCRTASPAAMRPAPCSTIAPRPSRCSRRAARASRASWSARARRPPSCERILTIAARDARSWQADARGASSPSPTISARRSQRCCSRRSPSEDPDAPPAKHREGARLRALPGRAGRAGLRAGRRITRSRCGSRNCPAARRHEPAARGPRARLCRRLGDRLARLFGARPRRLLRAGRADRRLHLHRPRRAASSRSGRGPPLGDVVAALAAASA